MGDYLNMVNNDKPAQGRNPNENTRASCCSSSSIGLEQNLTARRPRRHRPSISPYDQSTVGSRMFTGWTYPLLPGTAQRRRTRRTRRHDGGRVQSRQRREAAAE
jgi:hypothetical protein